MLGSQEKNLGPKVNVKFFTVDPYTLCHKVSRTFTICQIWQIWSLFGQKKITVVSSKSEIKFQKISKIFTRNSEEEKNTGHFAHLDRPNDALFLWFLNFP